MVLLLWCLAWIVHHSESILATMVANPWQDFSNILLLHDQDLLCDLHPLMTTDPTPEVMAMPSGIPPHMELVSQLKEKLNKVSEVVISFRDQTVQITEAVKTAIDTKLGHLCHVTGMQLHESLTPFQEASLGAVNLRFGSIWDKFCHVASGGGNKDDNINHFEVEGEEIQGMQEQALCTFVYNGHFYDVLQDFCSP